MTKERLVQQSSAVVASGPPARYCEWIEEIFLGAELALSAPGDPMSRSAPSFDAGGVELAHLFTWTMLKCGTDLANYSDHAVGVALCWLLQNHSSNFIDRLGSDDVPADIRRDAMLSLKHLYRDCLERRCPAVLSHLHEAESWPLQYICFMLWDTTPMGYWPAGRDGAVIFPAFVDVMDCALQSPNDAVIESALHGLGHAMITCRKAPGAVAQLTALIDLFLARRTDARSELLSYARVARTGCIQ